MGARSAVFTEYDVDPADLAQQTHAIANYFNMIKAHETNRVHDGGMVAAPTTASTQLTGPTGVTEWRVDVAALMALVGAIAVELAAAADHVIHDTTVLVTAAGQTCWASLVLKNVAGTITMVSVKGTPAATAAAVPPTDGVIQAAVGAGNDWVKLCDCEITRTADTTVTQTQDNSQRPILGSTVDPTFGVFTG